MAIIEYGETEELMHECSKMRQLIKTIRPALDAAESWIAAIEKQCRVWEFRLAYQNRGEEDED